MSSNPESAETVLRRRRAVVVSWVEESFILMGVGLTWITELDFLGDVEDGMLAVV